MAAAATSILPLYGITAFADTQAEVSVNAADKSNDTSAPTAQPFGSSFTSGPNPRASSGTPQGAAQSDDRGLGGPANDTDRVDVDAPGSLGDSGYGDSGPSTP
ncbi:hypothetical protein ACWD1U_03855, partial [Streptomyces sp. NPDC002788]